MVIVPERTEEWRAIFGLPGYEASSLGRIRSLDRIESKRCRWGGMVQYRCRGRVLKPTCRDDWYPTLEIKGKTVSVHSLVALAWYGPRPEGMEVNHKDGDKTNCRPDNLEYVTPSGNAQHALETGLKDVPMGSRHYNTSFTEDDIRAIRSSDKSGKELAAERGCSPQNICDIRKRRTWKHVV